MKLFKKLKGEAKISPLSKKMYFLFICSGTEISNSSLETRGINHEGKNWFEETIERYFNELAQNPNKKVELTNDKRKEEIEKLDIDEYYENGEDGYSEDYTNEENENNQAGKEKKE